ncbi:MAG: exodeoxyribonuclease I [Pseudomonadales bacterium]|nr:exodeoxyribonuclease I [Pseudomonadales bacterium]
MFTFFWHDYETWGVNPALDRPSQFAAIRTDADLNEIGEPLMFYAKPPRDALPHPEAALVTGITPQHAEEHGVCEAEFMRRIYDEMMQPNTCSVGFNSLRFDDEVTRFGLYRNFYDAYEREYKAGNSRWDIIDVLRLCAALRPEGIKWPKDEHGVPVYKLEIFTAANGIEQQGAHDALVDVRATIDVARLIKNTQPKLYDYAFSMRKKQTVLDTLAIGSDKPIFHISSMFGSKNYCASVVLPLCMHPTNRNEVICFDLRHSPKDFLALDVEEIKARVFSSAAALAQLAQSQGVESLERIAIKSIHINKCPMVMAANRKLITDEVAERIHLNMEDVALHYQQLIEARVQWQKAQDIFVDRQFAPKTDPDTQLYGGGFFSNQDKQQMQMVASLSADALKHQAFEFRDARLPEMLFRYRGRNFPESLTAEETQRWQDFCQRRLMDENAGASIVETEYSQRLQRLLIERPEKKAILQALQQWGQFLIKG